MRYGLLVFSLFSIGICSAQNVVHPNAHAHNDYEHPRPLLDALENGFRSVEVDIHLIDGELYVSHNRPKPSEYRTLQALYLNPLDSLRKNQSKEHPGNPPGNPVILVLVDVKTDATKTLQRLIEVLTQYPDLFPPENEKGFVQFVISGNRDFELILKTNGVSIDGRPDDLGKGYSTNKMPLISDHFGNWMHWNGKGRPSATDLQNLRALVKRVHAENRKLRLWASPESEAAWGALLDAGVDLINTDKLEGLHGYLTRRAGNGK